MPGSEAPSAQAARQAALGRLAQWHGDPRTLYVGAATTSLSGVPVQIVALDANGQIIHNWVIASGVESEIGAVKVHRVTWRMVREHGQPLGPVVEHLRRHRGTLVMFTPKFTGDAIALGLGVEHDALAACEIGWGQQTLSEALGAYNERRALFPPRSLDDLLELARINPLGTAPRGTATGNVQRMYALVEAVARREAAHA